MQDFKRLLVWQRARKLALENYLIQSHDLRLISDAQFAKLDEGVDHVRRMLIRLARAVRAQPPGKRYASSR